MRGVSFYESRNKHVKFNFLVSKNFAKKYGYEFKCLNELSRKINAVKLEHKLSNEISSKDIVYIPDYDAHPDHRLINKTCKKILNNKLIQYCSYNNSRNVFVRIWNKIKSLFSSCVFTSFKEGYSDFFCDYKLLEKISNQKRYDKIKPRSKDIFKIIKQ